MNKIKKTTIRPAMNDKTLDPSKVAFLPFSADGRTIPEAMNAQGVAFNGNAECVDNRRGLNAYRAALLALEYGERVTAFVALALNDKRMLEAYDATEKARADYAGDNTAYKNAQIAAVNIGKRLAAVILASGIEVKNDIGEVLNLVAIGDTATLKELTDKATAAHIDGAKESAELYAVAVRDMKAAKEEAAKTRARLNACLKDESLASGAFVAGSEFWKKLNG